MDDLKPCPFCGGDAQFDSLGAHCASLDCRGHVIRGFTEEEWNTRAQLSAQSVSAVQPVARVTVHKTGGNAGIAWSAKPLEDAPLMRDGELLYTHPSDADAVDAKEKK